ncbi:MAG TPA: thiamine pyrophosphate-dependent enzyme [Solirubrobacteraceae bacterium]|jgi:TPP-dependent pyruvate/acetoin dehydrogenase alpha subunit|nr:thiamine pyrophosphate-dependent enzyme [Solirubrobacteraceae bacterium]
MSVSPAVRLERFAAMLRARRFDETLIEHAEMVVGVFHVSIGMEATAAALALTRGSDDLVMLNHRNHGALQALGSDPEAMFREILGRDGGPQRGRGGSLHLCDPEHGVPYTSAMVAGGAALAVGMALARKRLGHQGIVFAFFGDGAMNEGAMHESLNLASLWRVPVLFVCESNTREAAERATATQAARSLHALAAVHQVAATAVDAADAGAITAAMGEAAAELRAGAGPRFLEARTPPWSGNAAFIPQLTTGRLDLSSGEDDAWVQADPILREMRAMTADGIATAELLAIDRAIDERMREAFERAAAAPLAPATHASEGVWA